MKRGTIEHPKTLALAAALKLPRYAAVGILESLWHFTAQYAPRGDIGRWSDEAIASAVGWDRAPEELLNALVRVGWLDNLDSRAHGVYTASAAPLLVHDWALHADPSIHVKLTRSGACFSDGQVPSNSRLSKRERLACARRVHNERIKALKSTPPLPPTTNKSIRKASTSTATEQRAQETEKPPSPSPSRAAEWPMTDEVIRGFYPTADRAIVERVVAVCTQSYLSVAKPKIPQPDDAMVSAACAAAWSPRQTGAGLFLTTAASVIRTWAELGRPSDNGNKIAGFEGVNFDE